jgi:hypothetical protein
MQIVQLFIENQRVELFKDENISLTQTIQNIRDISKVFADFTQTFTIPASKTNNKIFKHYYNFDIINGFDARKKVEGFIELNNIPFKTGKVKLEGVDMQDNKPYSYKITFFGNIVDLKDVVGDDKLSALNWLDNFKRVYSSTNVKTDLQTDGIDITFGGTTYTDAMCLPLIGCKTRLFYNSGAHGTGDYRYPSPLGGNLYYQSGTDHHHGVYWEELKYGLRVDLIVKAIEEAYDDINFTSDSFFNDATNLQYYDLYMWLHRRKGFAFDKGIIDPVLYNLFLQDTTSISVAELYTDRLVIDGLAADGYVDATLYVYTASTNEYEVQIKKDGIIVSQTVFPTGEDKNVSLQLTETSSGYQVFIKGTSGDTFSAKWSLIYDFVEPAETFTYPTGGSLVLQPNNPFNAQAQIPEMKVIDFLTSLFKMFNLTAYKQSDGNIKVLPLDDYYAAGETRDVTKYIDVSQSSFFSALPFREIKFQYKGRKTKVASLFEQKNGKGWGTEEYKPETQNLAGDSYFVEPDFEHMQFERLLDDGASQTTILVGNFIDDSDNPYFGSPLLFYRALKSVSPTPISFLNVIDAGSGSHEQVTQYCIPSNSVNAFNASVNDSTCHFSVEINENESAQNFDGSLYARYYEDYISDIFNSKRRLVTFKAKLPVSFLINYTLADTLIIAAQEYRINRITTNLQTGESELELLNVV